MNKKIVKADKNPLDFDIKKQAQTPKENKKVVVGEQKKSPYLFRHFLNRMSTLSGVKKAKRVGRGMGSGKGKTSGRGDKGQRARGQAPVLRLIIKNLIRKIPKRGMTGKPVTTFTLTMSMLKELVDKYQLKSVDREIIFEKLNTPKKYTTVKVVSSDTVESMPQITLKVDKISKTAIEFIEKNKGTVEMIPFISKTMKLAEKKAAKL